MTSNQMTQNKKTTQSNQNKKRFFALILTTLAAAIGVQSKQKLEEDFSQSSAIPFIIAGVVFTVLFVFLLILIVKIVLAQ